VLLFRSVINLFLSVKIKPSFPCTCCSWNSCNNYDCQAKVLSKSYCHWISKTYKCLTLKVYSPDTINFKSEAFFAFFFFFFFFLFPSVSNVVVVTVVVVFVLVNFLFSARNRQQQVMSYFIQEWIYTNTIFTNYLTLIHELCIYIRTTYGQVMCFRSLTMHLLKLKWQLQHNAFVSRQCHNHPLQSIPRSYLFVIFWKKYRNYCLITIRFNKCSSCKVKT